MGRIALALIAVGGCGYTEPTVGGDGANPPPASCPTGDGTLRLCVQFDGALTPTVGDGMHHTIQSTAVTEMTRTDEPAAHVGATSSMYIAPADAGDLDVTNLTIEMWISADTPPASGSKYWMLDNNTEYGMEYLDNGDIRCLIHDQIVDSVAAVETVHWHHVACTYNLHHLAVLIDGAVDNCQDLTNPIPTDGHDGVAIGANVGAGPMFTERFVGGLDNVRLYDRTLSGAELCTIAGNGTSCNRMCPGGGESDD